MSWTKTPPTKEGYYFWRMFPKDCYSILEIIKEDGILKFCDSDGEFLIAGLGGEWWDSPVPAPRTTFTIPQICEFIDDYSRLKTETANGLIDHIKHPKDGIAATKGET